MTAFVGIHLTAGIYCLKENLVSFRHVVTLVLIVVPLGAVLLNIRCGASGDARQALVYQAFCVVLIGHCNFSQVTSWVKSIVASILALAVLLFAHLSECPCGLLIAGTAIFDQFYAGLSLFFTNHMQTSDSKHY